MNNVMVDIETLDNKPTSSIVSIGAVKFGPNGYDEYNTFYMVVDVQSCIDAGLTVSADTIAWWMKKSDQARSVFQQPGSHLANVLIEFSKWLPVNTKLWGNGASFDNAILSNAYSALNLKQPWEFWNDRCYRTIAAGYQRKRFQQGVHHNALDDAKSQAEHLIQIAPGVILP